MTGASWPREAAEVVWPGGPWRCLAALCLLAANGGCGDETSRPAQLAEDAAGGGAGSDVAALSEVGEGSAAEACETSADCPVPTAPCVLAVCLDGRCERVDAPVGAIAPARTQVRGDCRTLTCGEGERLVMVAEPDDPPVDDGNPCTRERCEGPNPSYAPEEAGTACQLEGEDGEGLCDGAGACVPCQPGATWCDGAVPVACGPTGRSQRGAPCVYACLPGGVCGGVCAPGTGACDGARPLRCDALGAWETAGEACPHVCSAGSCVGSCTPGTVRCEGAVPQRCDPSGDWVSSPTCAFACFEGTCVGQCVPGERRCEGGVVQGCDALGVWQVGEVCPGRCHAGACVGECLPGGLGCAGQVPRQCDAAGYWSDRGACPNACVEGRCVGVCQPGAGRCDGARVERCDAMGAWQAGQTCPYACLEGGTCGGVCVPGVRRCSGPVSQRCDPRGQWVDVETCAAACEADGRCVPTTYRAVIVDDSAIFPTHRVDGADPCATSGAQAHGADIDAVELRDATGQRLGFFTRARLEVGPFCEDSARFDPVAAAFRDPQEVVGDPDGKLAENFVSLGGGWVIGEFASTIAPGHTVIVYEVGAAVGAVDEGFEVFVATDLGCGQAGRLRSSCQVRIGAGDGEATFVDISGF